VTNAINTAMVMMSMRQLQVAQGDVQSAVLEAPALDPETRSRLYQIGQLAKNASAAAARMLVLTEELRLTQLGTAGPPHGEVLSDSVAMEELKRQKQKESELASGLRQALHDSNRTQLDLHRGLAFLMPQIVLEDEEGVGSPGFQSPMESPDLDAGGLVWNSHAEFFAQVSALLEAIKTEWLSKYQETLSKFLEFFKEFTDILEKFKPVASGDKGNVAVDFNTLHGPLKELAARYGLDTNAFASFDSESAAMAFRDSLNLPGLRVTGPGEGGRYHVKMDVTAVDQLVKSMESDGGHVPPRGHVMDSAAYNAWISQKDSNVEQIKYVSKVLGEKLNEMTQKYDNIVKILSSTIDRMTEANKAYVQNT
jgi:type III secretion system IpaD/SipD/SspD family effector